MPDSAVKRVVQRVKPLALEMDTDCCKLLSRKNPHDSTTCNKIFFSSVSPTLTFYNDNNISVSMIHILACVRSISLAFELIERERG